MKNFLLFLALLLGVGSCAFAQEQSYTIMFTDNSKDGSTAMTTGTAISTVVDAGAEYLAGITSTARAFHKSKMGIKFGNSSKSGNVTFALTSEGQVNASKIVVEAARYSSDNSSLSVNGSPAQSITNASLTEFREVSDSVIIPSLWAKPDNPETEHLLLRPFVEQDFEAVYQNFGSSEEVYEFLPWNKHKNLIETKKIVHQWVEKYQEEDRYYWCIDLKSEQQKAIGAVYLVNENKEDHSLECGFCLGKKWWNQGIITQAVKMVCEYMEQLGNINYVWGRHDQLNPASGKVFLHAGFQFEKREDICLKDGNTKTIMFYKKKFK